MIVLQQGSNPILEIQIVDDAGLPVTGLVAATMPALNYVLVGANASTAFPTLTDLALITSAYFAGGVKERAGGYYRVDGPSGITANYGQTVRIEGEASGKHVLCESIQIQPPMGLDIVTKQMLGRQVTFTGVTTGIVTADVYVPYGFYNGALSYVSTTLATVVYLWFNGTNYIASTAIGTNGSAYFQSSGSIVAGTGVTWSAQGTAAGTTTVTGVGHAQLATYQFNQTCLNGSTVTTDSASNVLAIKTQTDKLQFDGSSYVKSDPQTAVTLTGDFSATMKASITSAVPTVIQIRSEMDTNSAKLAYLDTNISSRMAASSYVAAPSSAAVAAAVAGVLFVDGSTNQLKVNPDHTASVSSGNSSLDSITANGIAALRLALAGLPINIVGLVSSLAVGVLPIVQGDDYSIADGTAIPFACPESFLAGWTPVLAIDVEGSVTTLTASVITDITLPIWFEMTAAQSQAIAAGVPGKFALRFTKAGHTHTSAIDGTVNVTARIG